MHFINENELDTWVRGNTIDAQGLIVQLIARLVAVSSPKPRDRRFPLGDSIGQHGPDGHLDAIISFDPFIPEGKSFWEIGVSENARVKANSDYNDLTKNVPIETRVDSTFIFVTPMSGRKDWRHTWKEDGQIAWIEERKKRGEWKDIRVVDGTKLIDWVHQFIAIEFWLANKIKDLNENQIDTLDRKWALIKSIGEPPPLLPDLFLANRVDACVKLKELFQSDTAFKLKLTTHFETEATNFVSAFAASLLEDDRNDIYSRTVIISGVDAWNSVCTKSKNLILVAEPSLDLNSEVGIQLIQKALKANHSIIYSGPKGGLPDSSIIPLAIPRGNQVEEELKKAGYTEERARILAQQSNGNLATLLRCIQNLSIIPEWAQGADGDLAVIAMIGSWNENSTADKAAIETVVGKSFGEWIKLVRSAASKSSIPIIFRDGKWKFVTRFEGWYVLGGSLADEHIERFKKMAVELLRNKDPKFEMDKGERYAAQIYGKVLPHSKSLRNGLADTIALLGSHTKALIGCSTNILGHTANTIVRELLTNIDWQLWATLNDILPLLAEASPSEFLRAIELELTKDKCAFDDLFKQEGDGITGGNYTTGLLWGLETLVWDPDYLLSVTLCLGQLASRDPGGKWTNRPANSLRNIFLPWYPQTVAPIEKRIVAIKTLLKESPEVGWKLLLKLLHITYSSTSSTRKPAWRSLIPEDWKPGVTNSDYWKQIETYSQIAIESSIGNNARILDLINQMESLQSPLNEVLLEYLKSDLFLQTNEEQRNQVWESLKRIVVKHRKFSEAQWAFPIEVVLKIDKTADILESKSPIYLHRRLFSNQKFKLIEHSGDDYKEQMKAIVIKQQKAIEEIFAQYGLNGVRSFIVSVEDSWDVGLAFAEIAPRNIESEFLQDDLVSSDSPTSKFIGGFISARYHKFGNEWVDGVISKSWDPEEISQLLSYLPFLQTTWDMVDKLLGINELLYWSKVSVNPYQAGKDIDFGIEKLVLYGRPNAALNCLYTIAIDKQKIPNDLAITALLESPNSNESIQTRDSYKIVQIIKEIQDDSSTEPCKLFQVEWIYLDILDKYNDASPKLIEQELADSPEFFCEVISTVFRSNNDIENKSERADEQDRKISAKAYRLLNQWSKLPGTKKDGSFDSVAFIEWLNVVKVNTKKSGHFEVAMTTIGNMLINAPSDPKGLWIHEAVATILNCPDAQDMRSGYRTASFNSRGVFTFTSGQAEQDLANQYRIQAEEVEANGYGRFATMLRELASSYKLEAEREKDRDPYSTD